ncbi:hypothetical protein P154DRAFT_421856 [Amniculicola lignicola CBS 123094]|uniref:SWI/SNF family DNA-dependent ATPase Ris1 n=1 Tax=Amniculicola lignicola CBS 123094 TaxID=1392246 RepID=A0A6A5X2V0_9PLEO|nr:hypothetical protein P154DRAFT_421856 [Amniculicola lignicola CBS 123094]
MLDAPGAGSETLTALISNITPDDVPKEQREQTPARMKSQLKEHQKIALGWMMKKESLSSSKGSLLADEMGLGKTIEALALIVARPSDNPICKTTLIIAPVALMYQWKEEIECHIKSEYPLDVFVYHGNGKKATFDQLRKYDVVLTTFGTLASEYKAKEKDSREDSRTRNEPWPLIARGSMWYRIIMDEAQCIKNRNTLTSKATNDLQAHYRLCMTGTPMMNSVDELYPLIRFLGIRPYNDWSRFRYDISRGIKDKSESLQKKGYDRVRILLKSIMLRREKGTIIDGQPISNIPPKQVVKDMVQFSKDERDLYTAIETKAQIRVNKYLKENMVTNNYANILVMLLRLRQACCHPHLIKDLGVQVSTEGIAEEELMARAHQLGQDVVGRLKNVESGFECPICFDPTVNPTIFVPCGHTCCGECFQKLIDPAAAIGDNGERTTPRCPECRNGLSGERITDYVHFCKVHHREKLQELGIEATEEAESEEEEDDSSDSDDGSLDGFVVPDDADDGFEPLPTSAKGEATGKKKKKKPKKKSKVKGPPKTLAQLKQESLRSAAAKRLYHKRLRKGFESSTKIEKTIAILEDIYANNPEEKTLIFSQWTSLLDLLEIPLVDKKIQYQRYDGSMTMEDRAAAVGKFMKNADQRVMIMSLKAGNAGLNLTEASHVIILDPFWNPFIEDQAVGRVYRMHQTRQVHVHRVLVEDTVEHRICEIQDQKRQMVETALDERAHKSLARLGVGELMYLFGLRDRPPTH